ncbi:MAG: DUF7518 family protein [Halobacteriota archaeon]|uniref:DUF7518 family protein n=1 Tax=Natronomonas sp. TaxID=2184060 RepID=UPI003975E0C1
MSGNRVEELEAKVRKLEATIDGLTDELVETKERLGAIEDEAGIEPEVLEGRLTRSRQSSGADAGKSDDGETSAHKNSEGDEGDTEETADTLGDDIIVA